MLLVSFHGARAGKAGHNNVAAFDSEGSSLNPAVLPAAPSVSLSELRAIRPIPGGILVVNANQQQNSILHYTQSGSDFRFHSVLFSRAASAGLVHPFDVALDDSGHGYVSCQDTNTVLRFELPARRQMAAAAALPPSLPAAGTFAPGTFVASSVGTAVTPATPVPLPAGLGYAIKDATLHSVRGIVWANGALYVADQPACRVKVYGPDGHLLGKSNEVDCPVHLTLWRGALYVSGGDKIFSAPLNGAPGDLTFAPLRGVTVPDSSGLAFSRKGNLYVASRKQRLICKFDDHYRPLPFPCRLDDDPEFLLHL